MLTILDSLEYGTQKEEKTIINHLIKKYRLKRTEKENLAKEILEKIKKGEISKEDFFSNILNLIKPFSIMLNDIYEFLNYYKSFISTKSNIFKFNFKKLQKALTFDISNFPKELIEEIVRQQFVKEGYKINLDQELMEKILEIGSADNGFCNQFSYASSYFYTMKIKFPEYSFQQTEKILNEFFQHLELIVQKIIEENNFKIEDIDINFFYLDFENFVPEFKKKNNSRNATITLFEGIITNSNLTYRLNFAKLLLQFWKRKYIRKEIDDYNYCWHKDKHPYKGFSKREILSNPDIYFPKLEEKAKEYLDLFKRKVRLKEESNESLLKKIIEFVSLPYWRYRWHIYELWTLIKVFIILARLGDFKLNTLNKKKYIEIKIPKANAKEPVGEVKIGKKVLEIWYQRKTYDPIIGKGLEPDIRVSLKPKRYDFIPKDILIIENKDRRKASGSHIDKVINKYTKGTTAKCIFILNYESYSRKDLKNCVNHKIVDKKEVFILPHFKPSNFYATNFFEKKIMQIIYHHLKIKKDKIFSKEVHVFWDTSHGMSGKIVNTRKEGNLQSIQSKKNSTKESFEQFVKRQEEKLDKAEKMVEEVRERWKEKIEEFEVEKSVEKSVEELKKLWEENEEKIKKQPLEKIFSFISSLPLPEIPSSFLEKTSNKFLKEFDWRKFKERKHLDANLGFFLSVFLKKSIENYVLSEKRKGIKEENIKPIEVYLDVKELPIGLNYLGYQNPKKLHLIIEGDVENWTGERMEGGEIIVEGNCGDLTGTNMRDGRIIVKGDCGHSTGSWMRGGKIIVEGNCGEETGRDMESGELDIKGNVKSFAEFAFSGHNQGTIIWKGIKIWENGDWTKRARGYWEAGDIPIAKGV